MDREMQARHLQEAEAAVVLGAEHLAKQERIIADLRRDGHDTKQAEDLLATFVETQTQHVAHRDMLLQEIKSDLS